MRPSPVSPLLAPRAAALVAALVAAAAVALASRPGAAQPPVRKEAPPGGAPSTGARAPAGALLVVLEKEAATARLIDPASGRTLATLPTGPFPHEVAVSPDGRLAVVADYGAQEPGRTLTVLDLPGRRVLRTVALGDYRRPHGIGWLAGDAPMVAVTAEQSRAVLVVDVDAGTVLRAIPTEQQGTHMLALPPGEVDGSRAWTANIGSGSVSLLDLAAGRVVRTATVGRGPEGIDVTPDGREVWAADRQQDVVRILDATTLDSLGALPTGRFPNRLKFTPDGRWALVSNAAASTVSVYDVRARRLVTTVELPLPAGRAPTEPNPMNPTGRSVLPLGIQLAPDGTRAWIAANATGELIELAIPSWRVVRRIAAGAGPDGMAYVPAPAR